MFNPASILLRAVLDDPQGMKAEGPWAQQGEHRHGALPRVFREPSFAKSQTRNWATGWMTTQMPWTERRAASACAGEDALPHCPPGEPGPPKALSTGIISQLLSNIPFSAFAHKWGEKQPRDPL
ncbi:hypothetical protein E5288_WYG018611 [Bos mutus]|uniref:Uncharacterized protein n=1 Tax=Bos mutus TaxID=72004 RepID=A0A6B0R2I0_9CETA|nr:hypothetical protein [Bos mutus]